MRLVEQSNNVLSAQTLRTLSSAALRELEGEVMEPRLRELAIILNRIATAQMPSRLVPRDFIAYASEGGGASIEFLNVRSRLGVSVGPAGDACWFAAATEPTPQIESGSIDASFWRELGNIWLRFFNTPAAGGGR